MAPRTCHNFVALCASGYYDNSPFHRIIRNFMVQGGDPEGTGKGGDSVWHAPFADEFDSRLLHGARGVLSMANSGVNTNKSQFFITLKSCNHLDNKHSIFGRLVGGEATLRALELLEVDGGDRPVGALPRIIDTRVFTNPFEIGPLFISFVCSSILFVCSSILLFVFTNPFEIGALVALEEQAGTRPAPSGGGGGSSSSSAAAAPTAATRQPAATAAPAPAAVAPRVRPRAPPAAAAAAAATRPRAQQPAQKRRKTAGKKSAFSDMSMW